MSPEIATVLKITDSALSIWKSKLATKYRRELHSLKRDRINETDKNPKAKNPKHRPDRNIIDRIDRRIVLLSDLVAAEIARSKASNL